MRTSFIIICTFLMVGCASSPKNASLTADQATQMSVQLANEKASALYHCQPFHDGSPAHFDSGRWVWIGQQGYGMGDIQAIVELAANGSTNRTEVEFFDSRAIQ